MVKRSGLDKEDVMNYGPIYNLTENNICTRRIEEDIEDSDLNDRYQSVYGI